MINHKRIQQAFSKKKAFIGYLTAGDGGIRHTLGAALALIDAGINMLEIGVPFSDPVADGAVIQRASQRALASGTRLKDILWLAAEIRKRSHVPLILFSYLNPILSSMNNGFFQEAQLAGIDGVLIVDCPIEENHHFHEACLQHELTPIYVITPSTSIERIHKINKYLDGFAYYACQTGTTGVRTSLPANFIEKINNLKAIISVPVAVGFGISTPIMVAKVLNYADGVVIGSLFVKAIEDGLTFDELISLTKTILSQ